MSFSVLEICAGAGGEAIGLEAAGFEHAGAVEIDKRACETLRLNRPAWNVIEGDLRQVSGIPFRGVDMLAGGVPCPPFSIAGKQLGRDDDRDLFPEALRLLEEIKPQAMILENVPGFASGKFAEYRSGILRRIGRLGYQVNWKVLNASSFGVPQLRPRFVLVALRQPHAENFHWPCFEIAPPDVGEVLHDLMSAGGWPGADAWRMRAKGIAPTLVGGSKKHGGPDLGPTRAREEWKSLFVDGLGIADAPPDLNFPAGKLPRLTVRMAARIQGFPDSWLFSGGKTAAYRQIGNAFPPPVAQAVAEAVKSAINGHIAPVVPSGQLEFKI